MEIGLTAKVKPEIDERAADRQASKLQSKMEDAVSDLPSTMNLSGVSDHMERMQSSVERMGESFNSMPGTPMPDGGVAPGPLTGGSGGGGRSGGTQSSLANEMGDKITELKKRLRQDTQSETQESNESQSFLGGIANRLESIQDAVLEGAATVGLTGLALQYLGTAADKLSNASPLLGQVFDILGLAMSLFFRPFGTVIASYLLPIATGILQLAAGFNKVFGDQGFWAAIVWLADQIVSAIVDAAVGGAMGFLEGGDGEIGIADMIRTSLNFAGIVGVLRSGLLSMLPKVTIARILNVLLPVPGAGTAISKALQSKFGIEALEKSITTLIRSGIQRMVQRFVPEGVRAFVSRIPAAARSILTRFKTGIIRVVRRIGSALGVGRIFNVIKSRIGAAGGGILRAIVARLPSLGVRAFLTRLLPSIGIRAILSKIGLMAVVRALSGRLAYLIPVVGQIIGIIDLLVFVITALIPGMEAFSPIMWTLTQLFNLGVMAFEGLLGALEAFWGWLTSIDLGSLFSGAVEFTMGGIDTLVKAIQDIFGAIVNFLVPILETFKLPLMLLAPFAILGIELYNLLMGISWSDIVSFLNNIAGSIGDLGGAAAGAIAGAGRSVWNFISTSTKDIWEFVSDTTKEIWDFVTNVTMSIWDFVSNVTQPIWDFVTNATMSIWDFVVNTSMSIWDFVTNTMMSIWDFVLNTSMAIWDFVTNASRAIWDFVTNATMAIWDFVTNTMMEIWDFVLSAYMEIWDFVLSVYMEIWDFVLSVYKSIWDYVTNAMMDFAEFVTGAIDIANGFVEGAIDIAEYISGGIQSTAAEFDPTNEGTTADNALDSAAAFVDPRQGWEFTGLATGGLVTGPTAAIVGEGSEDEAVLPLSRLESMMDTTDQPGPAGGGSVTVDISTDVGGSDGLTETEIASALRRELGSQLDNIRASMDDLARQIRNAGLGGPIEITADGKVIAEVSEDGQDKYKRSREVNK